MRKLVVILIALLLISCTNKTYPPSEDFQKNVGTCYSIFPISYYDSNNDGYGDINGVTEKLPMLSKELNIDCIWINPIHPSNSYHKYDVDDYMSVDENFGTIEDFQNLTKVAHNNNIRIVMDFVINHSSIRNPLFIDFLNGKNEFYSTQNPEKDYLDDNWYEKDGKKYYASFWNEMPEFNFENKEVRNYFKNVAKFWLENGVDGFRVDAALHIYDYAEYEKGFNTQEHNIAWFKEFNNYIKSVNKDAFLLLEVWQPSKVTNEYRIVSDSVFNFDLSDNIVKSIKTSNPEFIYEYLENDFQTASLEYGTIESNFISNHDQNRLASSIVTDDKLKLAANVSMTLPGITWIYYGEELGMQGKKPDEGIREPYKWTNDTKGWESIVYNINTDSFEDQTKDKNSILSHYKQLTKIRKDYTISTSKMDDVDLFDNILSYKLVNDKNTITVIHNFSNTTYTSNLIGETLYGNTNIEQNDSLIIIEE